MEAEHVTRTVMELAKSTGERALRREYDIFIPADAAFCLRTGVGAIFSRKGDSGVRAILIKSLVLAELGVVEIANQIAEMPNDLSEKPVYLDGLLYSAAGLYPLAVKNPKEYKKLWQRAVLGTSSASKKEKDEDAVPHAPPPMPQLSPIAFKMITDTLMSHRSLSRRVKVWSIILMNALAPYAPKSEPLASDEKPTLSQCSDLSFFSRINETLYRSGTLLRYCCSCGGENLSCSFLLCVCARVVGIINRAGVKLLFCIFDRTDIEEDESYDEEIEFHLIIALFEHFLQLFAPFARTIRDDGAEGDQSAPLDVSESFHRATAPVRKLWPMVLAGLENLDDAIASPQRFSLILHILQVFEQLEVAFRQDEEQALKKLFGVCATRLLYRRRSALILMSLVLFLL